jgi:biopolymer transport protein ExbD
MARGRRREEEAFQMAPMIDMVFLLLVFFMTVSTMARDARPELELPVSVEARVPVTPVPRPILSLSSGSEGTRCFWYNRPVTMDELEGLLRAALAAGDSSLTVRAEAGFRWQELRPVLEAVRGAGFREWILCGFED